MIMFTFRGEQGDGDVQMNKILKVLSGEVFVIVLLRMFYENHVVVFSICLP